MGLKLRAASGSLVIAILAAVAGAAVAQQRDAGPAMRLAKAREIVQVFSDRLRIELSQALKAGPPASAIGLCHTLSPDLASTLAEEHGVELIRVALKLRNPENAPDEWEEKVLQKFQVAAAAGAELAKLEHFELVTTPEGDKMFRYMKAIPTGEMCLVCHGTDVKQDVKAEIARLYPEDKAVGFKLGDLRGAFSLVQIIEE